MHNTSNDRNFRFFFYRDLKHCRQSIKQFLRSLLVEKNDGNNDRNFVNGKVLSMLGTTMVKERFEKMHMDRNQAVTRSKSNHCSIVVLEFKKNGTRVMRMNNVCTGDFQGDIVLYTVRLKAWTLKTCVILKIEMSILV